MILYKFYLSDPTTGFIFLGALPERRRNLKRITDESILNWGRKYFGGNGKDDDIFFIKTVLEEGEIPATSLGDHRFNRSSRRRRT